MAKPPKLQGSKTEENLRKALKEETATWYRFMRYAEQAMRQGSEKAAKLFTRAARDEREHAEQILSFLDRPSLLEALHEAAEDEAAAALSRYANYEATARREGFGAVAAFFKGAARDEKRHEEKFRSALEEEQSSEKLTLADMLSLFRIAIVEEVKAQKLYTELAERCGKPALRRMFLKLVEDEERHEETLVSRYKSFKGGATPLSTFPKKKRRRVKW
ncbi:MAG: hypothetical protein JSV08_02185 [Acidobacteriota bacterium]|nr:MAG: hypothetical protein JSV08_02185 [Acidobacteriota bacterium]